ncbi:MAG: TetR/AcrR family transcriptional regulator, partial [Gemmatimonadota bacterium]
EEGLEGFSMRRLARSVGVTAPALYRHFDGKEDVLVEVVGEAFRILSRYLYGALGAQTPMARMLKATDAYLNFALDHRRFYETIHAPLEAIGIEELPDRVFNQACSVGQFWMDRHRELLGEGLIRESDPHRVSLTMWSHGHGLISLFRRGMLGEMDEEAFRRVYRASSLRVLRGVATEAGVAAAEAEGWPDVSGDRAPVSGGSASRPTPRTASTSPQEVKASAAGAVAARMSGGMKPGSGAPEPASGEGNEGVESPPEGDVGALGVDQGSTTDGGGEDER